MLKAPEAPSLIYEVAPAIAGGIIGRDSLGPLKEVGPLGPQPMVPEHFFTARAKAVLLYSVVPLLEPTAARLTVVWLRTFISSE